MRKITFLLFFLFCVSSIHAQVVAYAFNQESGTYTEITGGVAVGTETTDDQRFVDPAVPAGGTVLTGVGLPIGFDFTFNSKVYDRFAINANGWISLGMSSLGANAVNVNTSSAYTPLTTTVLTVSNDLVARISPLGRDLQAQAGATLRYETIGAAPNRVLVVQWKNYKKFSTTGDGDAFNFQIRLYETTNIVEFVYGSMVSNATSSTYQVGLRAEPNNVASNFVSRTSTTSWLTTTSSVAAADAVTMVNTNVPSNGLIFRWTPPACAAASGLTVNTLTNTSADIQWAAPTPAPAEGYEYVVSTTATLPIAPGTASAVNTLSLTGLTSNTLYYVYTRTVCDATNNIFGNWILSGTFRTLCDGVTDWQENFDLLTVSGTTTLPLCWSRQGSTGNSYVTTGGAAPGSAPNRYYLNTSTTTTANAILPPFSNLAAGTHRLKFKAYATVAGRQVRIGYVTNPTDIATFTLIQTVSLPGTAAASATEFTIIPGALPANATNLVLQIGDPSVTITSYYDDFKWEVNSTCEAPNALTLTSISDSAATLAWTPVGTETEWEVQYGPVGFALGTGTIVSGLTATNLQLTGLSANTNYQFYVRAICNPGDPTPWSNVRNFTTLCAPVTEWVENFDALTVSGTTTLPACWGRGGSSLSSYVTTGSVAPMSPSNRFYTFASFTAVPSTIAYTILPPVSNLELGTHRLRFRAYATALDKSIDVGYYTSAADVNSFVLLQTIPLPATAATTAEEFFVEIPPLPAGVLSLGLRNQPNATSATIYLDDFRYEPIPSCQNPTFLSATNITNSQAQLQWTANAGEFEWDIKYGAPGFNPATEGTLVAGIFDNPYVLTGLAGATNYSYYVRAVCDSGSNNVSPWEGPFNFRTKCDLVTTFSENFDALTAGANTLANCWGRLGNTATNNVVTGSVAPMSPSNRYNIVSNFAAAPPTFGLAVMPGVSNLNAGTHRLRFTAFSTTANAQISIGYLTNPDDPGSFVVLSNLTLPGIVAANAQEIFYEVPNTVPAGVNYLAIRNQSAAGSVSVFFDNVAWEPIPSCPNPTALSTSGVTSTQATLAWSASVNNTSWEIEYGITGFTQGSGTIVSASTNPFVLTGLTPATTYQFYVRGVCAGPENSVWSQVGSFTTACAVVTPNYSENFAVFPPNCWLRFGAGDLANGPTGTAVGIWAADGFLNNGTTGAIKVNLYSTNRIGWMISPGINLSAGGYQVKYDVGATVWNGTAATPMGSDDKVIFAISEDGGITWTAIEEFNANNVPSNLGTTKVYPVTSTSTNARFAFFATDGTIDDAPDYDFFIDNFVVETVPQNPPLCATNIQASQPAGCGNFPITITWNAVLGADGYKITAGTTPGGTNIANAQNLGNVTSFVFNTPTANTTYYYTIVAFNMIGDAAGCTELTFTTATTGCYCVPTSDFTSDYISNFTTTGGATNISVSKAVISPTGYGNLSATQTVTQAAGANFNFSNTFVGGTNGLRIWVDWNNDFNFDASESVFFLTNANLVKTGSITIPVNTIPGNYRMRVRAQWGTATVIDPPACGSISYGEALDFTLTVTPPAACPAPTGITTTIASSTSLNINWTNIASATGGYEWRVMNNNDPVATGTPAASGNTASGVTTALATGLVTGNTYQVYVRSLCDGSTTSDWSSAVSVTLSYCASVPASVDGQGITNIVLGATNFANTNASYTNHTATVVNVEQGENVNLQITFATGYAYATNVWIDFNNNLTFETSELVFQGTSTSANPTVFNASFTMPASAPLGNRRMRIGTADPDFGQVPPNPCYNGSWGVTLDFALNIQENLSLVDLPTNQLTFYPNPVKDVLNLVNNTTIERVEIYNLLGQQVMHVRTNATQTSVQVGELAKGAYIVKAYADGAEHTFKIIKN